MHGSQQIKCNHKKSSPKLGVGLQLGVLKTRRG